MLFWTRLIWGGYYLGSFLNDGASYNPGTGEWVAISNVNAPDGRDSHTAVWTGSEMIVWGGDISNGKSNNGGRYNPITDLWIGTYCDYAPSARNWHTAVWTGAEMIVWGGHPNSDTDTGGKYNPILDVWFSTSTINAPAPRSRHSAVWSGTEMIVWGGFCPESSSGGRYNPISYTWKEMSTTDVPEGRGYHIAVWTGDEMIVWGGEDKWQMGPLYKSGGRYNPDVDTWVPTSTTDCPLERKYHSAVWTGEEMIVWGGQDSGSSKLNSGGRYDPGPPETWTATSAVDAPSEMAAHTAIWTGSEMIIWGNGTKPGGRYSPDYDGDGNPNTPAWTDISLDNAPEERGLHTAVWTGKEMIIWGGAYGVRLNSGGCYDPVVDLWRDTSTDNVPEARSEHTTVWTGSEMITWGGSGATSLGILFPNTQPTSTPSIQNPGDQITIGGTLEDLQLSHSLPLLWFDDVEEGELWNPSSVWHVVSAQNCSGESDYYSPLQAWYFGDSNTCDYQSIAGTHTLTSNTTFNIDEDTLFGFRYLLDTDWYRPPGYIGDEARVEVSKDGSIWTTIAIDKTHAQRNVPLSEPFDLGLPGSWMVVDGGGSIDTWTDSDPCGRAVDYPLSAPYMIVDSECAGSVEMDEQLISPVIDTSICLTSIELQFDHEFIWAAGGPDEIADVDVRSSLTGGTWVNVMQFAGGNAGPAREIAIITILYALNDCA